MRTCRYLTSYLGLIALCFVLVPESTPSYGQTFDSFETSFEHLRADDIYVNLYSFALDTEDSLWSSSTGLSVVDYSMDFEPAPFDLLGEATHLSHTAIVLSVSGNRELSESLEFGLAGAYRDGFSNYRSLWLDTYFDQHFSPLEGVPGHELYKNFQSSALSFAASLEWEYIPANAKANVTLTRTQDNVSPGYEIDFDGIRRSDTVLATTSLRISSENVLTRWARSQLTFVVSDTTARDPRYSGEIAINAAINDTLTLRAKAGGSKENPQFEASYVDLALHLQTTERIDLAFSLRHYEDTGEIENALLFTTAAPELESDSAELSLRYTGDSWRLSASITYSKNDYIERNESVDFFQTLYADRDWTNLRLAVSRSF